MTDDGAVVSLARAVQSAVTRVADLASLAELVDLVVPSSCASCARELAPTPLRRAGPTSMLCHLCRLAVAGLVGGPAVPVAPSPRPHGLPEVWAVTRYEGVAARLVGAYKDGDRTDLQDLLGAAISRSVAAAIEAVSPAPTRTPVLLVAAPSSGRAVRRRGRHCVRDLVDLAVLDTTGAQRLQASLAVRLVRSTQDQAGLGYADRLANLSHAMSVVDPTAVAGRRCIVVDDVMTTGATLGEVSRVLRLAGGHVIAGAVAAATARTR